MSRRMQADHGGEWWTTALGRLNSVGGGVLLLPLALCHAAVRPAEAQTMSITGLSSVSLAENMPFSQTAVATNAVGAVTWALEGEDAGDFSIAGGALTMTARNFEDPLDGSTAGTNTYNVTVRATDSSTPAQTDTSAITVTIMDENEPPKKMIAINPRPASQTSMIVFWSEPTNTGPAITDYDVEFRIGDSGEWSSHPVTGTMPMETTISGLTTGASYEVRMQATNAEGTGVWSDSYPVTVSTNSSVGLDGGILSSPTSMSTYGRGERVVLTMGASGQVTVTGRPRLALDIGGVRRYAVFVTLSLGKSLAFVYTVQAADLDTDGIAIPRNALDLNGGSITFEGDPAVNAVILAQPARPANPEHKVNGSIISPPKVRGGPRLVGQPRHDGAVTDTYRRGQHMWAQTIMNQLVAVSGRPRLAIDVGGETRYATFRRADTTTYLTTLWFQYTVQAGDEDTDGLTIPEDAMELNSGKIVRRDDASVAAVLSSAASNTPDATRKVDGSLVAAAPSVSRVTLFGNPLSGDTYARGEKLYASVHFSVPVRVTGSPQLALTIGANTRQAAFDHVYTFDYVLIFSYTVQAADTDTDGVGIAADSLDLNGGAIVFSVDSDINATLTHTALPDDEARKVDGSTALPEPTRFTVLGLSSVSIAEGAAFSQTATTANAEGSVTWSLEGWDADDFSISSSGVLSMGARDRDNPTDDGRDNTYEVTVRATDSADAVPNTDTTSIRVAVNEADPSTPVVSISGGRAVTEGAAASFTVTASPAPAAPITVNLTIAETGGGFVAAGELGLKRVTVGTSGSATYTVRTVDDGNEEASGSVTATVGSGSGYGVHATNGVASVMVNDNDATRPGGPGGGPPPPPPGGGGSPPPAPEEPEEPEPPPPPSAPRAAITVDAGCDAGLCRARAGAPVSFDDGSTGTVTRWRWDFGDGSTSRLQRPRSHTWASPGFYEVTLTVANGTDESTTSLTFLVEAAEPAGTCVAGAGTRCLLDSRYTVTVEWNNADGAGGGAAVVHAGTNESALFRFFDADNWEMLIKLLDGCSANGHVWVFGAATTDLGYVIRVTDTATGAVKEYRNEPGRPADAITDVTAFPGGCGP
ncbi:MAG: PKD domain-containing protein [Holophagales bacterium]|nr:PKD domain-containing protein [Holophagales bacterium]